MSKSPSFTGTFDTVVTNIGDGWVPGSGAFIAPTTGTYFLTASCGVYFNVQFGVTFNVSSIAYCNKGGQFVLISLA
jgi:hypothetical protein